jgi:hypothetical protein
LTTKKHGKAQATQSFISFPWKTLHFLITLATLRRQHIHVGNMLPSKKPRGPSIFDIMPIRLKEKGFSVESASVTQKRNWWVVEELNYSAAALSLSYRPTDLQSTDEIDHPISPKYRSSALTVVDYAFRHLTASSE